MTATDHVEFCREGLFGFTVEVGVVGGVADVVVAGGAWTGGLGASISWVRHGCCVKSDVW